MTDGPMAILAALDYIMWTTVDLTAQDIRRNLLIGFQNSPPNTRRFRLYSRKKIRASQGKYLLLLLILLLLEFSSYPKHRRVCVTQIDRRSSGKQLTTNSENLDTIMDRCNHRGS